MISVGTRSLLWGSHQFILHPIFVALAWRRLYGAWPHNWRLVAAIIMHDWGYAGLPNMDGDEGKHHPRGGALLVSRLCDSGDPRIRTGGGFRVPYWYWFTAAHSRYYAEILEVKPSMLMRADKYATVIVPLPLYCLLITLSGEWREYLDYNESATGQRWERSWRGVMAYARYLRADWGKQFGPGVR